MKKFIKRWRSDKGSAEAVAFVILIPIIITFAVAFIDVGVYFNQKNIMTAAAQAGARDAAIYGGNGSSGGSRKIRSRYGVGSDTATDTVRAALDAGGIDPNTVTIRCGVMNGSSISTSGDARAGQNVGCTLSRPYSERLSFGKLSMTPTTVRASGTAISEVNAINAR